MLFISLGETGMLAHKKMPATDVVAEVAARAFVRFGLKGHIEAQGEGHIELLLQSELNRGVRFFTRDESFFKMQNLVKASTSLNSAHPEQLIATSFGANGPRVKEQSPFPMKSEQYFKTC